jgi:hypothetical protein
MANLFAKDGFVGWIPRVDATNADPGLLLRADNLVVDEKGALTLRPGSSILHSALEGGATNAVNSIHTGNLDGEDKFFYAVGTNIYDGSTLLGAMDDNSDTETAIASSSRHAFFGRGSTRKYYSGTTLFDWTPKRISTAPTVSVQSPLSDEISYCKSTPGGGEIPDTWDLTTRKEGTIAYGDGSDGISNSAVSIIPDSTTGRGMTTLDYTTRQNFDDILGYQSNDDDLVDFLLYVDQPERIRWVEIIFGCGSNNSKPFQDDRYEFRWTLNTGVRLKKKKRKRIEEDTIDTGHDITPAPEDVEEQTPPPVEEIPDDPDNSPISRLPNYRISESPNWTHMSVPRGQFERVGSTDGQNWSNVKAVRIVVQWAKGTTTEARFDNIIFIGGGNRSYTGKYRARIQPVARDASGKVIAIGPPSPASAEVEAKQQSIKITIPYAVFTGLADDVTNIWIYMYGGGLDNWYRVGETGVTPSDSDMTLDEFAPTADGTIDADDRTRLTSRGFTIPGASATPDLEFTVLDSELTSIIKNIKLKRGLVRAPENIIAIEGPYKNRMVCLTSEGHVYFSERNQHGTFLAYHTRVTDEQPLWMKATPSGLYVGTRKDVYRIVNEGNYLTEYAIDFIMRPLNVPHPPVDAMVWREGNQLLYRSADGPVLLQGETTQHFPINDIEPLWRGQNRHEIESLNTSTGRFAAVVDNNTLFMLAPEGTSTSSTNVIYRYSFVTQRWARSTYPWQFRCLSRGPKGRALAGTTDGKVVNIDAEGELGDNTTQIPINFRSRYDDGGNPLSFKDAFDAQIGVDTGGVAITAELWDEDDTSASSSFSVTSDDGQVWRQNIGSDFTNGFRTLQFRLSGNVYEFRLRHWNIIYRPRPEWTTYLDTGYVEPGQNGRRIDVKSVELNIKSSSNVTVSSYYDGTLIGGPTTVTVTPGVVKTYNVIQPRGASGTRARVVVQTTASDGVGNPGFECYQIRLRTYATGNKSRRPFLPIFPLQERGR